MKRWCVQIFGRVIAMLSLSAAAAYGQEVDLAALGSGGFVLHGVAASDYAGYSVNGAGDFTGDGLPHFDAHAAPDAGEAYVVFGYRGAATMNLVHLGKDGVRIQGGDAGDLLGATVAAAGDANGDGLADLIVGAPCLITPFAFGCPGPAAGEAHVIFSAIHAPRAAPYLSRARTGDTPALAVGTSGDGSNVLESRLQLVYAATLAEPFMPLPSVVNPLDNTISAAVSELGYVCIGVRP